MVTLRDILLPESAHYRCQHETLGPAIYTYFGTSHARYPCGDEALVRLPTEGQNLYCYAHAMETLRDDLASSRSRLQYWQKNGSKGGPGSWGTSIALRSASSDIESIETIIRLLEGYAGQKMRR